MPDETRNIPTQTYRFAVKDSNPATVNDTHNVKDVTDRFIRFVAFEFLMCFYGLLIINIYIDERM